MQIQVSSQEASSRFNELLEYVKRGEEVVIFNGSKKVARLILDEGLENESHDAWFGGLIERRETRRINKEGLPHIDIIDLIQEGRRE